MEVTTPEEAEVRDKAYWAAASVQERLRMVDELRKAWIPEDQREIKLIFELRDCS